ncbi:MAG: hypothetical protein SPL99_02960 [Catonella sp.]|nr:hypothetical protein [Catonella sp.]MDY6356812.1 hypothetical protein [Catonella sp.]
MGQYIDMDFDSLQQSVRELTEGRSVSVRVKSFQNDMTSINSADDVLTLLIHLGYLVYNRADGTAKVPNREVMSVFVDTLRGASHRKTMEEHLSFWLALIMMRIPKNMSALLKGSEKEQFSVLTG